MRRSDTDEKRDILLEGLSLTQPSYSATKNDDFEPPKGILIPKNILMAHNL